MITQSANEDCARAYLAHHDRLVRMLTSVAGDRETAEDIAQEAFLRLAREISLGRSPANVGGWLYRVGHNLALSGGRRKQVAERRSSDVQGPPEAVRPDAAAELREIGGVLGEAMKRLPELDRHVIRLAASGFDGREIARHFGWSPGAARTRLCRARSRLRADLELAGLAYA